MKRIKAVSGATEGVPSSLELLRAYGAGPDPGFRAGLRERLLAEARATGHKGRLERADGDPDGRCR
jgi:hypothetical protein